MEAKSTSINALDVETWITELRTVLADRRLKAVTPYKADTWCLALTRSHLILEYPYILHLLQFGFFSSIPAITNTYTPSYPSLSQGPHHRL
ncbi:hypothetical protein C8R48DRAFT_614393 [Suillus tomentosus]|nr:hypothetical protein C8R48DRAFT_614393 [Suillus tomentosus]